MDQKTDKKLQEFLTDRLNKIYVRTLKDGSKFDISAIKAKGFTVKDSREFWNSYKISNLNTQGLYIHFKDTCVRELQFVGIVDKNSNVNATIYGCNNACAMLYRCLDEIEEIAKLYQDIKNNVIKHNKIIELSKNSIEPWMKAILEDFPYSHYITESENKFTLSVKLKNNVQLDIPVYYKRFHKIMPKLLNTIQQFEKTMNENEIKVLISNSSPNQQWNSPKSKS
jgi:hypothetical protein